MATTIGALRVELSANIAKFEAAMGKAAKNMARTQRSFAKFGSQASAAGRSLSIGLTAPLVGIGAAALRSSVAFESAFAGVIKTVDDATDGMGRLTPVGEALQQGFRDLSLQIPIAATELAGIGEVAGQLGIESENILGFTEVMAKLGVTTNLSAEEAATSLAQLANITSLPQTEFERLGSTVVALGNNLATNEAQIVDFGKRIASAGNLAGLTEPQILAIGGAMASVGVESEAGGTAVQKVLNAMTKSVAQGGEKLEIFARTAGLSAAEFQRAFREDAAGAFASFVTGLGQQGDAAFTTLDGLTLGNERVVRSFLSLAAKSTTLTDALALGTTAWKENTALAREADIRFATTASQLKLLANQVVEAGRALGDILKPILQTVVGIVREQVVPWLKTVVDRFKALSPEVQTSRILWLGFAAALGPALIAVGGVTAALTPLLPLFGRIWIAAGRMANALVQPKVTARALSARLVTLRASLTGLSLSARASAVGVKLASVALTGLRFAIRGVIAALGPMIAVFAAFEFAAWAAGALDLGGKLKRLVGITDDAADAARDADAAYEGLAETLAQTTLATERQALAALERGYQDLVAQLERARESNKRAVPGLLKRVRAQEQAIAAAQDRVKAAQQEVEAEQAAARAATDYTEALQAAAKEAAGITDTTGKQIRAARTLGVSLEELSKKFGISTEALKIYLGELAEADTDDLGDGVGTLSDEVQTLVDRLRGTGAIQAAENWAAALDRVGGLTTLTDDETTTLNDTLQAALGAYQRLGDEAPAHLVALAAETGRSVARAREPLQGLVDDVFSVEAAAKRSRDALANLIKTQGLVGSQQFGRVLPSTPLSIDTLGVTVPVLVKPEFDLRTTGQTFADFGKRFQAFGTHLSQTFVRAVEGGGGVAGALGALGTQVLSGFGDIATKAFGESSKVGTLLSGGLFAAIPGIGPFLSAFGGPLLKGLGALGKKIGGFFKQIFGGPSEAELAGRQAWRSYADGLAAESNAEQIQEARGAGWANTEDAKAWIVLRDSVQKAGGSAAEAEAFWTRYVAAIKQGPEAVAAVTHELDGWRQKAGEVAQAEAEIAAQLAARNTELAGSLAGLVEAGHAAFDPAQLDPYLSQMQELGLITADEAASLRQMADDAHVDWRGMEAAAKQYGVGMKTVLDESGREVQVLDESLLGLGHAQAKLTDEGGRLASAWELLTDEGGNTQAAIAGMTDEAQGFVTKALEMGIALPASMKPMLEAMVEQGRLTDQDSEKLEDLSGLTFADPIAAQFDRLADSIQMLIIALGGPSGLSQAVEDMVDSAGLEIEDLAGEWAGMTEEAKAQFGSFAAFVEDQALRQIASAAGLKYDEIAASWEAMTDEEKAAFESFAAFLDEQALKKLVDDAGGHYDEIATKWEAMTTAQRKAIGSFRAFVNDELAKINDRTVTVTTKHQTEGSPSGGDEPVFGARHGTPFRQFGRGTPAMLHGFERVMTGMEGRGIAAALGRITGGLAAIADLSGVRALAKGGLVTRPTLTTFAEHGPEVGIPLERLEEFGGGRRVEAKLDQLHQDFALLLDEFRHGLDPRRRARALVVAAALSTA